MATIFFIAYDYDTNYIFEKPIINVTDTMIVDTFDDIFTELGGNGYNPGLHVIDN